MLPHATAMLQQPRLPPSGEQQATEIEIKWREVLRNKKTSLELLSKHTGQPVDKLERDMDRPYYMTPEKARDYGVIDRVLERYPLIVRVSVACHDSESDTSIISSSTLSLSLFFRSKQD